MRNILILSMLLLMSCAGLKKEKIVYVPAETKIEYRDSLIYIRDTIKVEVPKEVVKEVIPQIDTSYLKTSLAESIAYIDTLERKLHHTLTQKGEIKIKYDTIIKVEKVTEYIEKPVIQEVEVRTPYIPKLFWVSFISMVILIIGVIVKLIVKLR